jgi:hypothetical protein
VKLSVGCHNLTDLPLRVYRNTPSQHKHRTSQRTPTYTNNHAPNFHLPPTLLLLPAPRRTSPNTARLAASHSAAAAHAAPGVDSATGTPSRQKSTKSASLAHIERARSAWTEEENMRAAARFEHQRERREKEAKTRKEIAPCVADVVERHCRIWEEWGGRGERGADE